MSHPQAVSAEPIRQGTVNPVPTAEKTSIFCPTSDDIGPSLINVQFISKCTHLHLPDIFSRKKFRGDTQDSVIGEGVPRTLLPQLASFRASAVSGPVSTYCAAVHRFSDTSSGDSQMAIIHQSDRYNRVPVDRTTLHRASSRSRLQHRN